MAHSILRGHSLTCPLARGVSGYDHAALVEVKRNCTFQTKRVAGIETSREIDRATPDARRFDRLIDRRRIDGLAVPNSAEATDVENCTGC
jgi:hypothetical protein